MGGSSTAVFTVVAKNYLPQARVLMRSVAEQHPGWGRLVILVDEIEGYFDPRAEKFEIIPSTDLPVPKSPWFHFKYSVMELSTAVKPYAFQYIFEQYGFDRIVFLDPDIRLFSPMTRVIDALASADIVLTPHLTAPLEDDRRPTEIDILRSGAYNLGFIALAQTTQSAEFVAWWQQRLYDHCVVDLARGMFVDQRWIDLVPGLFDRVAILRDLGYNVAYWNISHRQITKTASGYHIGDEPLCFFHFSGYDCDRPDHLSRHQNRHILSSLPEATRQIVRQYCDDLQSAGYAACCKWPYTYNRFRNGALIPDVGRPIHHEAPEILEQVDDPFSDAGFEAFVRIWNSPVEDGDTAQRGISRLAYRIYRTRTDVQSAMPDIFGSNYQGFLEWMMLSGKREHGLGDVFLTTVVDAIRAVKDFQEVSAPLALRSQNAFVDAPAPSGFRGVNGTPRLRMTRLVASIYESRAELQRYFPDPYGHDSARFLVWLLTYGKKEHHLSAAHLAPMNAQWKTVVSAQPTVARRLRYEVTLRAFALSVVARSMLERLGLLRARFFRQSRKYAKTAVTRSAPAVSLSFGVNLVGYFQAQTGVGQSVRSAGGALAAASLPVSRCLVGESASQSNLDRGTGPISNVFPYSHNLLYVNADQTYVVRSMLGTSAYNNRRNIGYWTWELDEFPVRWADAFHVYDEIWVPSSFCRDSIAEHSPIPVFQVPYAVFPEESPGMDRQHFGLAPDRFIFLHAFDVLSVPERKNPLGVVRAFQNAFCGSSRCQLVIKVNHADARPEYLESLRDACTSHSIRIIDSTLSRREMDALTRCADCVVSLHRSEGFGLLMAEGMYFGKPVIATNYSGNVDFTRPDNSMLVNYRLIPVGPGCEPYSPSSQWAEPDLEHASLHMLTIANEPGLREKLSAAGREFVRSHLSAEAVGRTMQARLEATRNSTASFPMAQKRKTSDQSARRHLRLVDTNR